MRPHSSLAHLTPEEFTTRWQTQIAADHKVDLPSFWSRISGLDHFDVSDVAMDAGKTRVFISVPTSYRLLMKTRNNKNEDTELWEGTALLWDKGRCRIQLYSGRCAIK